LHLKGNQYGLGYEKNVENLFHIPDYCKPITFVSSGFLDDVKEQVHDVVAIRDNHDGNDDENVDVVKDD